jgi:hypothetical protein
MQSTLWILESVAIVMFATVAAQPVVAWLVVK